MSITINMSVPYYALVATERETGDREILFSDYSLSNVTYEKQATSRVYYNKFTIVKLENSGDAYLELMVQLSSASTSNQ